MVFFNITQWALTGQYSMVCYTLILANGLLWLGDQHRISERGLYFLLISSFWNLLKMQNISQSINLCLRDISKFGDNGKSMIQREKEKHIRVVPLV